MGFLLCVRAWEEGAGQLADARAMRLVVRVKVSSIESGRDGCATRRCRRFARVRARAQATRAQATRARARARLRLRDVYSGAPCARQHLYKLRERKAPLERSARLRICEDAKSRTWRTKRERTHTHQRPSMRLRNKRAQMLRWKQARIRALCALSKQARTQHSVPTFWYRHTSKSRHSRAEKRSRFWDRFSVPKTGPFFGPDSVVIYKSIMVSKSGPVFRSHFWDRKTVPKLGPLLVSRGCVFAAHFLRAPLEILLWLATQGGRPDAHF